MQLRYTFRIEPGPGQRIALGRAFGCARVVYNDALRAREDARRDGLPFPKTGDLSKLLITEAKHRPERAWLSEVSAVVLQQTLRDLDTAYRNFFDGLKGKRPRMGAPRFKSKRDNRQAVRFTANARWSITPGGKLRLPKIGEVKVRWSRELPSTPSTVTVVKDAGGRYFASFVVETDGSEVLPGTTPEVGIDLGLTHFAVLSDGRKISAPRFFRRAEKKLRKAQQNLARKTKGSSNRKKAVVKVARAHARVTDARKDFHHKLSTTLIRENQAVHVEDLCVKGLARTRLAKSVHDAGWSAFVGMLEYKAARYGRTLTRVDRFFPSSQICSACGFKDGPKPLAVRDWTCQGCGTVHDRDVNAARNIKTEGSKVAAGQAETVNARGAQVRPVSVPAPRATRTPVRKKQEPTRSCRPTGWVQAGIPSL
ncbi:RNA-guided endonuclease InsQ/TnpB family protein [Microbispora bryophytorum]|uniref:IS200/IS605 family element transposase accessory protein TnpB n=1 Tax=Microbispora bryophytorum subsp. camponoti TaxID=1677852 RepID=A0ABR8L3S8_9ACTN|nr:RNA-guided endonuclease TnpB family protein [Microbispora camponoti]MBD3143153.1 IS200/IS605 family element transposase accessory protein TnpB [Microbispora camponoti]